MNSSYYITLNEKLLKRLKIDVNSCVPYNKIFDEKDDKIFLRKLRNFYLTLCKMVDEKEETGEMRN